MAKPYVRDTVEFFKFTLADGAGKDLTSDTVQCAIHPAGDATAPTWIDCTWDTGTTWRTSSPITWNTTNYPARAGGYHGWAKISDSPETPWVDLGRVPITER